MASKGNLNFKRNVKVVLNMFNAARRLELESPVLMLGATIYHKVEKSLNMAQDLERNVLGGAALLIASKTTKGVIDYNDVANIYYSILYHNEVDILKPSQIYNALLTSMGKAEYFVLRALQFEIPENLHVHYLTVYMKSIYNVMPRTFGKSSFPKTCWTFLTDIHLSNACIKYSPKHLAISIIILCVGIHIISLPGYILENKWEWTKVLVPDLTADVILAIRQDFTSIYATENREFEERNLMEAQIIS